VEVRSVEAWTVEVRSVEAWTVEVRSVEVVGMDPTELVQRDHARRCTRRTWRAES